MRRFLSEMGCAEPCSGVFDDMYNQALPTKLSTGRLIFDFGREDNVESSLDLQRAEAKITIGREIHIKSYLHANELFGMIQIDQPGDTFSFRIENPQYSVEGDIASRAELNGFLHQPSLKRLIYPGPQVVENGNLNYFTQTVGQGFSYGVFMKKKEKDGKVEIAYISFTWMAEFYAIQKNGNGAARQLELFWKDYCSPNGFHLNGDYKNRGTSWMHYRPFTLEGNFGAADALQEMLLFDAGNELHLFPAIPDEWLEERVAFKRFRVEKGLLVSAVLEDGIVTSLTLEPEQSGTVILKKDHGNR